MTTQKEAVTTAEASAATAGAHLRVLASECGNGTCPTVYGTDRDTVVVQGYVVTGDNVGVEVPDGEHLIEIPVDVLLAAADEIRNQA